MRRIAIAAIVLALGGGSALTTLIATTSAQAPGTGIRPRLVIDRVPPEHISKAIWKFYTIDESAIDAAGKKKVDDAAEGRKCTAAADIAEIKFELIQEQILEKPGGFIPLKKKPEVLCVAAVYETAQPTKWGQKTHWTGLFDFRVIDDQIIERAFNVGFYSTKVRWDHKYGEPIKADHPYTIATPLKDQDGQPLFELPASGDNAEFFVPEEHCFDAKAEYTFSRPQNLHLGKQVAKAKLPGGRNTACGDKKQSKFSLQFELGRVDVATFADENLAKKPGTAYFPTPVTYVFTKINSDALATAPLKPIVISSETGERVQIFLNEGTYRLAARFQPSDELTVSPEYIEVQSSGTFKIDPGKITENGKNVNLNVGGVTLEWQSATAQEVVYKFYRDEQFFFRGAPTQPPFLSVATKKKKIDVILPEGTFRVFASAGAGDTGTVHATVEVKKGKLTPTAPTTFKVGVARVKFRLTGVSGEAKLIPSVWEIFSDDFSRGVTLTNEQAVRGIQMAPGTYNVEVPWRNRLYKTRFHISAQRPQDQLVEVINWDR